MAEQTNELMRLSAELRSAIRSGVAISSMAQSVEELVLNSIDAEATMIEVEVNLTTFKIRVDDNGKGIQRNDLEKIGSRYTTSKCHSLTDLNNLRFYGFRGEALASIIDISGSVELLSKTRSENSCFLKKFSSGHSNGSTSKVVASRRTKSGLSITLSNFMAKYPVRQKLINRTLDLEDIKSALERILLINHHVSLTFSNEATYILRIQNSNSIESAFQSLYVTKKQGMSKHNNLLEVFFSFNVFDMKAFISKASHHSKNFQIVFVNKRFVSRGKIHRALHQFMTATLGFNNRKKNEGPGARKDKSSSQDPLSSDKYPVYVVDIHCPYNEYDITFDPRKTIVEFRHWATVLKGLEGLDGRLRTALEIENKLAVVKKAPEKQRNALAGIFGKVNRMDFSETQITSKDSEELRDFGKSITTHAMHRAVHSRVAIRGRQGVASQDVESDDERENLQKSKLGIGVEKKFANLDESSNDSEEIKDSYQRSKGFNEKLRLSTVSKKPSYFDMRDLKRKSKQEETTIYGVKKHCVMPARSKRFESTTAPNLLKSIAEKFSPWRVKGDENQTSPKNKKFVPLKGIPKNRKRKIDDTLSDTFGRLSVVSDHGTPNSPLHEEVKAKAKDCKRWVESLAPDNGWEESDEELDKNYNIGNSSSQNISDFGDYEFKNSTDHENTQPSNQNSQNEEGSCSWMSGINDRLSLVSNSHTTESVVLRHSLRKKIKMTLSRSEAGRTHLVQIHPTLSRPGLNPSQSNSLDVTNMTHAHTIFPEFHTYRATAATPSNSSSEIYHSPSNALNITDVTRPHTIFPEFLKGYTGISNVGTSTQAELGKSSYFNPATVMNTTGHVGVERLSQTFPVSSSDTGKYHSHPISHNISGTTRDHSLLPEANVNSYTQTHCGIPKFGPFTQTGLTSSPYFSPVKEMELDNHTVTKRVDNPHNSDDVSQYFSEVEDAHGITNQDSEAMSWSEWEFHVVVDVMNQEWLHSTNKDGRKSYMNLATGENRESIVQMTGSLKLTAAQALLLEKSSRSNWLSHYFPRTSNTFWKADGGTRISKNGNMTLAEDGNTIFGPFVRDYLKGENDFLEDFPKWREGYLDQLKSATNGIGSSTGGNVRVGEYWERPTELPEIPIINLASSSELNCWFKKGGGTCRFAKDDFSRVRVIGQLDKKFIVGTVNDKGIEGKKAYLVLFDQHAVHERIRLEQLLGEVYQETESGIKEIISVCVSPPIVTSFDETEIRVLSRFTNELSTVGVKIEIINDRTIKVLTVPKCFAEKIANEAFQTRNETMTRLIVSLLQEQVHHIKFTRGSFERIPSVIHNILCSHACHGAIKFGDELSLDACIKLIQRLGESKVPFQCAHGRPALIPIMDLNAFRSEMTSRSRSSPRKNV